MAGNVGRRGSRWRVARASAIAAYGDLCAICHHRGANEVDHITPLHRGGAPYDPDNLRVVHGSNSPCPVCRSPAGRPRSCNQERKRNRVGPRARFEVDPSKI